MKPWVCISKPFLCNESQHCCSGFGNLPNFGSLPAVTESPPQLPRLLMGTSIRAACFTVTDRTQKSTRASLCPPWFAIHKQDKGQQMGTVPIGWQLVGWSPKTSPKPCLWSPSTSATQIPLDHVPISPVALLQRLSQHCVSHIFLHLLLPVTSSDLISLNSSAWRQAAELTSDNDTHTSSLQSKIPDS